MQTLVSVTMSVLPWKSTLTLNHCRLYAAARAGFTRKSNQMDNTHSYPLLKNTSGSLTAIEFGRVVKGDHTLLQQLLTNLNRMTH